LREEDCFEWSADSLKYIGGVDISADKNDRSKAIASLVILEYPSFETLHSALLTATLDTPYVPGFLAFREVDPLLQLISESPIQPQVILVDGNGILHVRGFGLASHLGVLAGIPTIGVGKTVFAVDGITAFKVKQASKGLGVGEHVELVGNSGKTWGAALRCTEESTNPVIVSVGHMVCLATAIEVVKRCCFYRVPEPIRLADKISRRQLDSLSKSKF